MRPITAFGWNLPSAYDWTLLKSKRDAYIARLNGIYESNLAKRNIELLRGRAHFADAHTVAAAARQLTAPHIVIAVGGRPMVPADRRRRAWHHFGRLL